MGFGDELQGLLEVFEPGDEEMAVLQHQPVAAGRGCVQELKGNLQNELYSEKRLQPLRAKSMASWKLKAVDRNETNNLLHSSDQSRELDLTNGSYKWYIVFRN